MKAEKNRALRIKFEDSRTKSPDLDPKGSRSGESPSRIFDKLVERASREMRSSLAWSSHKVRCPVPFARKLRVHGRLKPTSVGMGRHQASNESLILAQNQRWRRA